MCSANQTASSVAPGASGIGEIIRAIDQLAADSRAGTSGTAAAASAPELAARVAGIWAMLAALDPALDRLITRYEVRDR